MRVFVTDCEGPITKNDNAFELCCHFIPKGEEFFRVLSKYDDYLYYVERRQGYQAGSTLKFVFPFLLAFGLTEEKMLDFSLRTLTIMPKAIEVLRSIRGFMPVFIVSTSYSPYLKALCGLLGISMDHVFCTSFDLRGVEFTERDKKVLRELAQEIASFEVPQDLTHERALKIWERLDTIFFKEGFRYLEGIFSRIETVGAKEKAKAVKEVIKRTGSSLEEVMYVGDSITDFEALKEVKAGGGLSLAFNANRYALEAAEVACLAEDLYPLAVMAYLFHKGGREEVLKAVSDWREVPLLKKGVPREWLSETKVGIISGENLGFWILESENWRKRVRGVKIGELG